MGAGSSLHAVQFYDNEERLCSSVADFLAGGLTQRHLAIAIATGAHAAGILQKLAERRIDVDVARRLGDLVLLDAEDTLESFMVGEVPDARLFERRLGGLIDQTRGDRTIPMRAYGEMVDLLWRDGRAEAAIRLEILWNQLAATRPFSLLCGYSMGNFYKQTRQFQEICSLHTHVQGPDAIRTLPV